MLQEISALPGRIRFRSHSLFYNKPLSMYMNIYIDNLYGVKYSMVNRNTASILVVYDPLKTNTHLLRKNIEQAISSALINKPENIREYDEYYKLLEKRDKAIRNFFIYVFIYLGLKIKNSIYGKFALSTNARVLQAAAAVTIIGGYPLLKRIYRKFSKNIPTDSDILLALTALSFTLARESSKGVLLLMLKAMNDYIKYSADAQCQRLLNQSMNKTSEMACPVKKNMPLLEKENMHIHQRVSKYQEFITPISLGAGAVSYLLSGNIMNALAVLLALTPSGTGTALSTGIKSYISLLNKHKIFVRRPETFEKVVHTNHVIFDKTGTLTNGRMNLEFIASFDSHYSERELLKICAACESEHYHPISITLKDENKSYIDIHKVSNSILIPSKGVQAFYENHTVLIGNKEFMDENKIGMDDRLEMYQDCEKRLFTPVLVSIDGRLTGMIAFADTLKEGSHDLIKRLKQKRSFDISLLTGDNEYKARDIAQKLGIRHVYGNCSNEDKAEIIRGHKTFETVMMVGDGINDIDAMREADVSVSFANSSCDMVKLNSDYIIFEDHMLRLSDMVSLSQRAYGKINQSITLSQLYNIFFGGLAFVGAIDAFAAKSINTINSLMVLLLNKRIEYLSPERQLFLERPLDRSHNGRLLEHKPSFQRISTATGMFEVISTSGLSLEE